MTDLTHPKHRVRALHHGHLLADSGSAVLARQAGQPDRYFFPREGVEMEVLVATGFSREFAGLGVARAYTLNRDASIVEHAAWSFEDPSAPEEYRGLITFDLDVIQIEEDEASDPLWDKEADKISDYIRHTDSGSGRSQEVPWAANRDIPSDLLGENDDEDEDAFTRGSPT